MDERDLLKSENQKLTVTNTEMASKMKKIEEKLAKLNEDIEKKSDELDQLHKDNNKLNRRFFDLQKAQEELIKGNVKETKRLLKQLQATQ
ncbi:unnamed protein product, partial [marine sediment metagenome]